MSYYRSSTLLFRRLITRHCLHPDVPGSRSIKRWVAPTLLELHHRCEKIGPEPEKRRSTYLEWNFEAEIYAFGKRLGEEFNTDLLKQALIQKEYANLKEFNAKEKSIELENNVHNHELITEGDEIIKKYIVSEYSRTYPNDIVQSVVKYLTSEDMLAHVGKHLGLTDLISTNEFPVEKKTLSNTFKAVVAALQNSKDLRRAQLFVKDFLFVQMVDKHVYDIWKPEKPFEYLKNLANQNGIKNLESRLCNQSARNTILANYQIGIYSEKNLLGMGWGECIDIAKETAALNAIHKIYSNVNKQK